MSSQQDSIIIVDYDILWPAKARDEIAAIHSVNPNPQLIVDIQHVGSTAIPEIKSKPILDLYVGVASVERAKELLTGPLEKLGYQYWNDNPNPHKMFFVKGMPPRGKERTHHVHVVQHNSDYWQARIVFRDFLQKHRKYAVEYEKIKLELMGIYRCDREAYTEGKSHFVRKVLKLAGYEGIGDR